MEQNSGYSSDPLESRGWEIVKALHEGLSQLGTNRNSGPNGGCGISSLEARKLLAEYFKLGTRKPSRLHSAVLSCAVKMVPVFADFHFAPFIDIWGFENIRPDDSETRVDEQGRRFPSLMERVTKAYAYSLLFHPAEHIDSDLENLFKPVLTKKGYRVEEGEGHLKLTTAAIATKVFSSEVRNRKMTFVQLLMPDGNEIVTEVHTLTAYSRMRYEEIEGRMFDVILRSSDNGKLRVEAAILSERGIGEVFETSVGYVEHIDFGHHHIHIYDNKSRHLVAMFQKTGLKPGEYVEFVPVIPKGSNFKTAIIVRVIENGAEAFGYRNVKVTYVDEERGYAAWELLPDATGKVLPIVESGAKAEAEPAVKGYVNKALFEGKGRVLPVNGKTLRIVTFLKRGKDGKKRPFVVDVE